MRCHAGVETAFRHFWRGLLVTIASLLLGIAGSWTARASDAADGWDIRSTTRYAAVFTQPAEAALSCPDALWETCQRHALVEMLSVDNQKLGIPGLEVHSLLRYRVGTNATTVPTITDTYSTAGDLKVLGLTLQWHNVARSVQVTAGRQSRWDADPVLFDGASLAVKVGCEPWTRASISAYGGIYAALDADLVSEALIGSLFPQEVKKGDVQLGVLPTTPILGISVRWTPLWTATLTLSDTAVNQTHYMAVSGQQRLFRTVSVQGVLRLIDADLRDVHLSADYLGAKTGTMGHISFVHARHPTYTLSAIDAAFYSQNSRLLIGDEEPFRRLYGYGSRRLHSKLTMQVGAGATLLVNDADQTGFQRNTLDASVNLIAPVHAALTLHAGFTETIAPDVGIYRDNDDTIVVDSSETALQIQTFPNITGEGEAAVSEGQVGAQWRAANKLRLSSSAGFSTIHRYQTQFVILRNWSAYYVQVGGSSQLTSALRLALNYRFEQDLHEQFGLTGNLHELHISAQARF